MANTKLFECVPSDMVSLERVRYFPRMLITPDDMTADQDYLRNKLRRHNRLLHGWGVVCGCEVTPGEQEYQVKIAPGYILGPYGDEIIIWKELTFDIRTELVCGCTVESGNGMTQIDPWCSDVKKKTMLGQTYYIAVKYKEIETRPVRAHPVGCSCDQVHCESSRILDSFMVKALDTLPSSHDPENPSFVPPLSDPNQIVSGKLESCVECPSEPWVILADVTLGDNNMIEVCNIDNCCHRRWVISLADVWWICESRPGITKISPQTGYLDTQMDVEINGCNFKENIELTFTPDNGLTYATTFNSMHKLTVSLQIGPGEEIIGFKDVTITNPDGQSATLIKGFEVIKTSVLVKNPLVKKFKLPKKLQPGKEIIFEVIGSNFKPGLKAYFGKGKEDMISIRKIEFIDPQKAEITAYIWTNAKPGIRELIITNPDGKSASTPKNFKIKKK